jgi:hypothetical protein
MKDPKIPTEIPYHLLEQNPKFEAPVHHPSFKMQAHRETLSLKKIMQKLFAKSTSHSVQITPQ